MLYTCTVAAKTDDYIGYRESCHAFAMSHLQVSNSETVLCEILKLELFRFLLLYRFFHSSNQNQQGMCVPLMWKAVHSSGLCSATRDIGSHKDSVFLFYSYYCKSIQLESSSFQVSFMLTLQSGSSPYLPQSMTFHVSDMFKYAH